MMAYFMVMEICAEALGPGQLCRAHPCRASLSPTVLESRGRGGNPLFKNTHPLKEGGCSFKAACSRDALCLSPCGKFGRGVGNQY